MIWLNGFEKISTAIVHAMPTFPEDSIPTLVLYQLEVWRQVHDNTLNITSWSNTMGHMGINYQDLITDSRVSMNHALLWKSLENSSFQTSLQEMIQDIQKILKCWESMDQWDFLDLVNKYAYWASNSEYWDDALNDTIFEEFTDFLRFFYSYVFWKTIAAYWKSSWDSLIATAVRIEKFPLTNIYYKQIQFRIDILSRLFCRET